MEITGPVITHYRDAGTTASATVARGGSASSRLARQQMSRVLGACERIW